MDKVVVEWAEVTTNWDNRFVVVVGDKEGREYTRQDVNFINRDRAVSFASKIEDRGYLDVNLWDCRIPYGSNAWISDGMEQRTIEDERNGLI